MPRERARACVHLFGMSAGGVCLTKFFVVSSVAAATSARVMEVARSTRVVEVAARSTAWSRDVSRGECVRRRLMTEPLRGWNDITAVTHVKTRKVSVRAMLARQFDQPWGGLLVGAWRCTHAFILTPPYCLRILIWNVAR